MNNDTTYNGWTNRETWLGLVGVLRTFKLALITSEHIGELTKNYQTIQL